MGGGGGNVVKRMGTQEVRVVEMAIDCDNVIDKEQTVYCIIRRKRGLCPTEMKTDLYLYIQSIYSYLHCLVG